jgi:hypothetical protein
MRLDMCQLTPYQGSSREIYPVERHIPSILENIVVRVSHEFDIAMSWLSLLDKVHHDFFGMLAVACERSGYLDCQSGVTSRVSAAGLPYLFIHDNVDFNPLLGLPLEDRIQPPLLVVKGRTAQKLASQRQPYIAKQELTNSGESHQSSI